MKARMENKTLEKKQVTLHMVSSSSNLKQTCLDGWLTSWWFIVCWLCDANFTYIRSGWKCIIFS